MEYEDLLKILTKEDTEDLEAKLAEFKAAVAKISKSEKEILRINEYLDELKGKLVKYEALGTPEEIKQWIEMGKKLRELLDSNSEFLKSVVTRVNNMTDYLTLKSPEAGQAGNAQKHDELQKQLEEAKKRLANYKEPDYGPIETFDDVPDTSKAQPEDLKAKLAQYKAIGTPEELRLALEKAQKYYELLNRSYEQNFRIVEPRKYKFNNLETLDLEHLFDDEPAI